MICYGVLLLAQASANGTTPIPRFELRIKPLTMDEPLFEIGGSVNYCTDEPRRVVFIVPKDSTFRFTRNGSPLDVSPSGGIAWPCDKGVSTSAPVLFQGTSPKSIKRCAASHHEIFCLNNSVPNPEVISDRSTYRLQFDLPKGYSALIPDSSVEMNSGIQFQLAKFHSPRHRKTKRLTFEYRFPLDFSPMESYLGFMEETLEGYLDMFGELPFHVVKVGAIRRGEKTGEISGSPAGNLILFSRTALGDKPNLDGLRGIGIQADVSDALRKMVIAHELSHFWFANSFVGKDGWMVEGIPNYLGLVAVWKSSQADYAELRKFYEYMDSQGPQDSIPNRPFGEGPLYIKAYYQGALALAKLGEAIGHEPIIKMIAAVYHDNSNPEFTDFDRAFKKGFPSKVDLWETSWRVAVQP
jgi:hypothetical protein